MDEPWVLRLAMGSLSMLPAVVPTYAAIAWAVGGSISLPTASVLLALAVAVAHAVFWLAPISLATRQRLALVAVALTLAAVTWPGAAGGAFLLWAYPAVMVGFATPARWGASGVLVVGGLALVGLAVNGVVTGRVIDAAFSATEAVVVVCLAGVAAVAVGELQRSNAALRRAETHIQHLAVEQERARMARDLHDLLGQSLSLIQLKLQVVGQVLHDPQRAGAELAEVDDLTRRALQETRQAISGFRQPTLASEIAGAQIACGAAGIDLQIADTTGPVPEPVESTLAWSLREAVTNVVRHSAATACRIGIHQDRDGVHLWVGDNGRGAPPTHTESGLRTLRERVAGAGGTIGTDSQPAGGFTVRVSLPLADGGRGTRPSADGGREGHPTTTGGRR